MKVLVVDDEEVNIELLRGYLDEEGFEVLEAENGQEGWSVLEQNPDISLILLDRMMPKMDGIAFIKKQKSDNRFKDIPVIMQTAVADEDSVAEGIEAGVYYYLVKPYKGSLLLSVVHAALEDSRYMNELIKEVGESKETLCLLTDAKFEFTTHEEAQNIAYLIANSFPEPKKVILGLSEVMINAVEHGNLGITYDEKGEYMIKRVLDEEIEKRHKMPEYNGKIAKAIFEKMADKISVVVKDEGGGFNWKEFFDLKPDRIGAPNGRGILMAKTMSFDFMEYNDKGNEVRCGVMVK